MMKYVLVILVVFWSTPLHTNQQQFDLPMDPLSSYPGVQVDREGRVFVAAGNQLLKLNSDLVLEQNVSLVSRAINISISPEGDRLIVCKADLSCLVYNTGDLSVHLQFINATLASAGNIAVFIAGSSFYMGSSSDQTIRLGRVFNTSINSHSEHIKDYTINFAEFQRKFIFGFSSGKYSYFVVLDSGYDASIRVMRTSHNSSCCASGSASCSFTALSEDRIFCGTEFNNFIEEGDSICGVSVVDDFGGKKGAYIVLSRCHHGASSGRNLVCSVSVTDIDYSMDESYDMCFTGQLFSSGTAWAQSLECGQRTFTSKNCFSPPLGDIDAEVLIIPHDNTIDLTQGSSSGRVITASRALKLDGVSLIMVAYTIDGNAGSTAMFHVADSRKTLSLEDEFNKRSFPSLVRSLQWQSGLDYVLATTQSEIMKIPLEECSSNTYCSSCVGSSNPLCGWCISENKCSRVSKCRDGNSTSSIMWISSNPNTPYCIIPDRMVLNNREQVNISVYTTGLAANITQGDQSCSFEDVEGRFTIVVPAVEVIPSTSYTCHIADVQVPPYNGVKANMKFSFISSQSGVLLNQTSTTLTIFNCNSGTRCSDCLKTMNACGWCVVNKLCRGTAADCTNSTNFLQLGGGQTIQDVCPLLDLKDGITNYAQPVRISAGLQLTTRNLPSPLTGFSYQCHIGNQYLMATWNRDTSLTCHVEPKHLTIEGSNELLNLSVIWTGPNLKHEIGSLGNIQVDLYDCKLMAADCSSCVQETSGYPCVWCGDPTSQCSISEECNVSTSTIFTMGTQCPDPIIMSISPTSGPLDGGTIITILGTDLGVTVNDFHIENSIKIGERACTPLMTDYISGKQILCMTQKTTKVGRKSLIIKLSRLNGVVIVTASMPFYVINPIVNSVEPAFGPKAGGTMLTIRGTDLNIGNSANVTLYGYSGPQCKVVSRKRAVIKCVTPQVDYASSIGFVAIHIDKQIISDPLLQFQYRHNPTFLSIQPHVTILSGGVNITFNGSDLDVARNPQFIFNAVSSPCTIVNSTSLTCITPAVNISIFELVMYLLRLDNAPPPDLTKPSLQLSVRPDPIMFKLITEIVKLGGSTSASNFVLIEGQNLYSIEPNEIAVTIGGRSCDNLRINSGFEIICRPPLDPLLNDNGEALVDIFIGLNLNYSLDKKLHFIRESVSRDPSSGAILLLPFIIIPLFLLCCILILTVWLSWHRRMIRRKSRVVNRKECQFSNFDGRARMNSYDGSCNMAILPSMKQTKSAAELMEEMTMQLPKKLIISMDQLTIMDIPLGQGQFGIVHKANMMSKVNGINKYRDVAVKSFKGLMYSDVESVFAEIFKMQDLSHPNVMSLVGVCTSSTSGPSIVMPYMQNGSLLKYLRSERKHLLLKSDANEDKIFSVKKLLLRMCHQISLGMAYLSSNLIVHRDLATRNCLLDYEGNIKVSDFGLSEDVYITGYFRQNKEDAVRLPFKWMAPESLRDGVFTQKSDVWSYGVTCWEVFSTGRTPYPGVDAIDLFRYLEEGVRLDNPANASSDFNIYSIMLSCWDMNPDMRPSFEKIISVLANRLQPISEYVEMNMFLQPQSFGEYECMNAIQEKEKILDSFTCNNGASKNGVQHIPLECLAN